jgi:hypothetical protein
MAQSTALIGLAAVGLLWAAAEAAASEPIRLHPDNPHYFLFRGKPTILLTSGEHYGAVLNLDFDYAKYLDTLQRCGLNHTRTFVGAYCEAPGAFNIAQNTLAPAAGRFICPWARSDVPGYANGGSRFDLTRWDPAYFARLRDFVAQASRCGVVVEVNLFCPFYEDSMWALSPMNAANNVNGVGSVPREEAYTLDGSGGLLPVQEAMVRKVVGELGDFDNLYYEIMNEPYAKGVPDDWQRHIADLIVETERGFPHRHLISQNIANGRAQVEHAHPAVSILNFHYAWPPDAVALNYDLNRVIGDNETGFRGTGDDTYRMEGWAFILAGGGLFNHLDYSFTAGHEGGTFAFPPTQPGGGGPALREQFGHLSRFMQRLDFVRMRPDKSVVRGLPEGCSAEVLAEAGKQYALYLYRPEHTTAEALELALDLPTSQYRVEWVNPLTGAVDRGEDIQHAGGERRLMSPRFVKDVALAVVAKG